MRVTREHWILVALIVLCGGAYLYFTVRRPRVDPVVDRSTYRTNAAGTKALYEWLKRRGFDVQRLRRPLTEIPQDARLLCVLLPTKAIGMDEIEAVTEWVADGGHLLLSGEPPHALFAVADPPAAALARRLGLAFTEGEAKPMRLAPPAARLRSSGRGPYLRDVEWVELPNRTQVAGGGKVILGSAGKAALVEVRRGEGKVVALGEAAPLSNGGLLAADNAVLAANLFYELGAPGVIYFDEYHHGFSEALTLGELAADLGLTRAAVPVALALLAALWGAGRRFGSIRPAFSRQRRRALEFVEGYANLYQEAKASGAALELLYESFRRRVATSVGASATASNHELARLAAGRTGVKAGSLERLLEDTRLRLEGGEADEQVLLDTARSMSAYRREFYVDA
ncbi:MAG: DUF4350 domain-containing protein [Armatimonadota bacterium]